MNADNIFYLDWNTQELFGWENNKSDLVIDSIIRGIEAGDDFPPVPVHRDKEKSNRFYISPLREISPLFSDAGHYRALGHYIADKPLKCELCEGLSLLSDNDIVAIPNIIIVDDLGHYKEHKERFPNYR